MLDKSAFIGNFSIYKYQNKGLKENLRNSVNENKYALQKDVCCFTGVLGGKGLQPVDPNKLVPVPMDWDESKDQNITFPPNSTVYSSFSTKSGIGKITNDVRQLSVKDALDKAKEFAKDPKGFLAGAVTAKVATTSIDDVLESAKKTADTVGEIKEKWSGKEHTSQESSVVGTDEPTPQRLKEIDSQEHEPTSDVDHITENHVAEHPDEDTTTHNQNHVHADDEHGDNIDNNHTDNEHGDDINDDHPVEHLDDSLTGDPDEYGDSADDFGDDDF